MRDRSDREEIAPQVGEGAEPEEIREEIETTRADMSETVDAIQERLSPEHLVGQAKESVREATIGRAEQVASNVGDTARETGGGIVETIKQNPIPAALAAVGIGWLWRNRQSAPQQRSPMRYDRYGELVPRAYEGYPSGYGQPRTGETGQVQERAGELASQVQSQAGQAVDQAQERVGEWTGQAQQQMQSARSQFDRMLQENPLALAVAALGLGAAVGLAVPETQREKQMMGPARDTVMEKAQAAAQQTMEKAQQVADTAQQAATEEAKEQGLTQ